MGSIGDERIRSTIVIYCITDDKRTDEMIRLRLTRGKERESEREKEMNKMKEMVIGNIPRTLGRIG